MYFLSTASSSGMYIDPAIQGLYHLSLSKRKSLFVDTSIETFIWFTQHHHKTSNVLGVKNVKHSLDRD